jgi:hypothetical protein
VRRTRAAEATLASQDAPTCGQSTPVEKRLDAWTPGELVSTLQTQPPMVADELRWQADQFIDLADLEASGKGTARPAAINVVSTKRSCRVASKSANSIRGDPAERGYWL